MSTESSKTNQSANITNTNESWLEYQMHVLSTIKKLDETFARLDAEIRTIEKKEAKDMTEVREEINQIKLKMEKELNDIKMQLKVEELERLTKKLESAKEDGARNEKIDSHIDKKIKLNWILISAIVGSSFAAINLVIKFLLSLIGVE